MSAATCPTCGNALDPLRAPVAKVIGGKIVTFCSPGCAAGQSQKMAAAKVEPAAEPRRTRSFTGGSTALTESKKLPPAVIVEDEPDEPARVPDLRRRRNRRVLLMTAALVAGGAAVVVIQAVSPSSPGPVSAEGNGGGSAGTAAREVPAEAPVDDVEPSLDVRDPDAVRAFATSELAALVAATPADRVPRISREAARALSRTGDKASLDVLARALEDESEITRVEVAYALARGGDERGTKALLGVLKSQRRDVRADAARALVQLGDKRGVPVLENLLGVSQFRLGAAEALAPLGVERALETLEKVRKDDRASREDRLRALVALGRAGKADVAADLRAVLGDRQFNVGAAEALARLGDTAAKPVLGEQLAVQSLQVGAALGLRRLEPTLDPAPYLPGLVAAMNSGKDTAKVSAAEAILVLTGPPAIAERD